MNLGLEECPHCGRLFKRASGGIKKHIRACEGKAQREQEDEEVFSRVLRDRQGKVKSSCIPLVKTHYSTPKTSVNIDNIVRPIPKLNSITTTLHL